MGIQFYAGIDGDLCRFTRYEEDSAFVPLIGTRVSTTWLNLPSGKIVSSFYCIIRKQWEAVIRLDFDPENYNLADLLIKAGWHDSRKENRADDASDDNGGIILICPSWRAWRCLE